MYFTTLCSSETLQLPHEKQSMFYLVGIVGAGDQQENPGERVLGWIGNLPGLGAWMKRAKKKEIINFFFF